MSGDVGAEVAAVLEGRMSLGTSGRWIADYGETPETLADALAPLIAERVEAAQAEALREAADELEMHAVGSTCRSCGADNFAPVHYSVDLLRNRAAALDPGPRPDPRHEGKSPTEWLFAEDEG